MTALIASSPAANFLLRFMRSIAQSVAPENLGDRIIKVNHAGEHGAICIYSGQIFTARITAPRMVIALTAFRSHEERHRSIFGAELQRRGCRRCRSYWLCGFGGYVLGLITGLLGPSAIAATTVAVESVVLRHLEQQLATLRNVDPVAVAAISAIVAEERQHHDSAATAAQPDKFWHKILMPIVSASTEAVIWLGMRL
jgi:3-demethoxyubiquinol 3-hydroxylase